MVAFKSVIIGADSGIWALAVHGTLVDVGVWVVLDLDWMLSSPIGQSNTHDDVSGNVFDVS
jgi:hypothetical protein